MNSLVGQTALVTGAGRGIGKAIAAHLAAEGVRVGLVARSAAQLEETAEQIRKRGGTAVTLPADVTDPTAVQRIVRRTTEDLGPISLLINNAGTPGPYGPLDSLDPLEWWSAQAVNVLGPALLMNAVLPGMRTRRLGRVVNIVSNAALQPVPHLSAYAVSKSTLTRLTETVDLELRDSAVLAFALHPGNVTTDMARGTMESAEAMRWLGEGIAMIRDRKPEDSNADLERCCLVVAAIAAGRCDELRGRYLDLWSDIPAAALSKAKTPL